MIKPSLTNFTAFVEKPKPVIPKSKAEIQKDTNSYMNIALFLIVIIGFIILYYRNKYQTESKQKAQQTVSHFEDYMNDYVIHSMLEEQNNNIPY